MQKIKIFSLIVLALALSACVNGRTSVKTGYYAISGTTAKDLDRAIKRNGPKVNRRHAVAVAAIRMEPKISFRSNKYECDIHKAKVNIQANIKLPRWTNRSKGSRQLRKSWKYFAAYAKLHEQTHVKIADAYARIAEKRLRELPTHKSCKNLRKAVKRILNKISREHDKAQRKFDADEARRFRKLRRKKA